MKAPLKSQLHAMCVCMAARLTDCAKALEEQAHYYRQHGDHFQFKKALKMSKTATEARKLIREWEAL